MRDVEIINSVGVVNLKSDKIEDAIKEIVRFTHKRDTAQMPIIETRDFYDGIKYTLAYLKQIKNIEL